MPLMHLETLFLRCQAASGGGSPFVQVFSMLWTHGMPVVCGEGTLQDYTVAAMLLLAVSDSAVESVRRYSAGAHGQSRALVIDIGRHSANDPRFSTFLATACFVSASLSVISLAYTSP
ncbi:hypothetical protein FB45DRAFT_1067459 [Roridomyces roridus]|uniref:Uncharacterized protein n=1 Tax=Roridomyces roridus TaxID=1738132 RepID=A0AAD7B316_9AGAR|nr:hypothetical protein FB45DRAFT_1067459 [Roridomyces roridus]